MSNVLYVGDVDPDTTKESMATLFGTYGKVTDVWLSPKDQGYAFVTYQTVEEAVGAKHHLHGRRIGASAMRINYRKPNALYESVDILRTAGITDTLNIQVFFSFSCTRCFISLGGGQKRNPGIQ